MKNWMLERIQSFGDRTVFIMGKNHFSYHYLAQSIVSWQAYIQAAGIQPGEVVAVVGDFNAKSAGLIISLLSNKNIVVPLTVETSSKHDRFFQLANVTWYFSSNDHGENWTLTPLSAASYHPAILQLQHDQNAGLILFTSGTTGESKGAVLNANSLLQRFEDVSYDERKALRCIVFLKIDHIGGLNTLFSIIFSGGTAISIGERTPTVVCQAIEDYRVQLLPTTPTFLNMMLLSGAQTQFDLSSLQVITYGTEPMPASTLKAVHQSFPAVKLKQTYGLTELGIFATRSKDSSSGWLEIGGEGVETRVVEGILQIKTPTSMLGYLNAPSPFTEDGFYITGDRVEIDGQYYRILGRDSEIINVGGEKVYPAEVESVLLEMPNVHEVLVVGKSNPVMGHIVCAHFLLKEEENKSDLVKRMTSFCHGRLEPFKVPKLVFISQTSFMSPRLKKARNNVAV